MQADTLDRTEVDTSTLEDWAVPCDVSLAYVVMGKVVSAVPCDLEAKWAGNYPCCGIVVVSCDDHHTSCRTWRCEPCDVVHRDLIEWRLL